MSISIEQDDLGAFSTASVDVRQLVKVDVDSLIAGRVLEHGLYDQNGILLLARRTLITSEIKRRIRSRKVDTVFVQQADAENAAIRSEAVDEVINEFDTSAVLASLLDSMLTDEALLVSSNGPAVKDGIVLHGCKAYDPNERRRLIAQHAETATTLDELMRDAVRGGSVNGNEVATAAATFLTELTADSDNVLSVAAEASRDNDLAQHCLQMALLGMAIGIEMGFDFQNVRTIGICGLVHDWGMTSVKKELREAPRRLSRQEYLDYHRHPVVTLEILQQVQGMPRIVPLVCYQVHERPNGRGYPRGRCDGSIHPFAQVLCVADSYVALTQRQAHRPPLLPYSAMECLLRLASIKAVSTEVVRALLRMVSLFPIGSIVSLSDGSMGGVIRRNGDDFSNPIVKIIRDFRGRQVDPYDDYSIISLSESGLEVSAALPNPKRGEIALEQEELLYVATR